MTAGARGARLHQPDHHPFSVHVLASSLRRQVGRVPVYRVCGQRRPLARTTPSSLRRQGPPQTRPVLSTPTSQTQGVLHRSSSSSPSPTSTSLLPPTPFASACSTSPSTVHRPRLRSRRRGVRGSARRPESLRLRAAASGRSLREVLVAMVPILRHQPSSFALLLPADGARALHTSALYLS
ncbi:hypothetical protein B0H14DRAFT_326908 [Mycena olivaceomarginata]|nr:hypothetical protein B0H14DRAFT_326908 [Mycena olivaceomarginata]